MSNYTKFVTFIFEFTFSKDLGEDYNGYIYQVKYTVENSNIITKEKEIKNYELYNIVFPLNKNHILIFKIKSDGIKIPETLINNIKINNSKNYASYIDRNIVDGNLSFYLQRYYDYNHNKIQKINITVLERYYEVDKGYNLYERRFFGLNYDSNNGVYHYDIEYILSESNDFNSSAKKY